MSAIKTQKDFQFTFEKQATWSTAIDTAPIMILTDDMPINIEPNNHNVNVARGIRGAHEKDNWNDLVGSIPTASMTSFITPTLLSGLLPAMMQNTTSWSGVASVWSVYSVDTCTNWPNPKDDGTGYFYTLTRRGCATGTSVRVKNAVPTNYTFSISESDNEGALYLSSEWIGQGYQTAQTSAGTVRSMTISGAYSYANIGAVSWGAYDLLSTFVSAEISITNGARYVRDLPTGPIVFNGWEVTGSFTVAAGSNTDTMKTLCQSASAEDARHLTISFGDGTVNAAGDLNITVFCYLNSFTEDFSEGETVTFNFRGVFGTTASNEYPARFQFYYAG